MDLLRKKNYVLLINAKVKVIGIHFNGKLHTIIMEILNVINVKLKKNTIVKFKKPKTNVYSVGTLS